MHTQRKLEPLLLDSFLSSWPEAAITQNPVPQPLVLFLFFQRGLLKTDTSAQWGPINTDTSAQWGPSRQTDTHIHSETVSWHHLLCSPLPSLFLFVLHGHSRNSKQRVPGDLEYPDGKISKPIQVELSSYCSARLFSAPKTWNGVATQHCKHCMNIYTSLKTRCKWIKFTHQTRQSSRVT